MPLLLVRAPETYLRKLIHLERAVDSTNAEIEAISEDSDDTYLLQQHNDCITESRTDLKSLRESCCPLDWIKLMNCLQYIHVPE